MVTAEKEPHQINYKVSCYQEITFASLGLDLELSPESVMLVLHLYVFTNIKHA